MTIGAGLSQPKELKDLLGNLITMVIRVLKDCNIQSSQLSDVFAALIEYVSRWFDLLHCEWLISLMPSH